MEHGYDTCIYRSTDRRILPLRHLAKAVFELRLVIDARDLGIFNLPTKKSCTPLVA